MKVGPTFKCAATVAVLSTVSIVTETDSSQRYGETELEEVKKSSCLLLWYMINVLQCLVCCN